MPHVEAGGAAGVLPAAHRLGRTQDADLELILDRFRLPQTYEHSYALTADDLHDVTDGPATTA